MPRMPAIMPADASRSQSFLLDPMDTPWQNYPLARVNRAAWKKGEPPLWNSLSGCGEPLVFSGVGAVTSPLRFWTALVEAGPAAWDYFLVLRLILAGILAWLWASSLSLGPAASAGVSAAFMLSGHMALNLNQAFLDAEVLLPGLALGAVFLGTGRLRAGLIVSALTGGAILLSGQPQSALVAFGFAAAVLVSTALRRGSGGIGLAVGISAGAAALMLGAPAVLGIADFLGRAHHLHSGQGMAHEPIAGALSLAIPWVFGEFGEKWLGMNPFRFLPYLGVSVILAAVLGIRKAVSNPAGPALILVPGFLLAAAYGIPPVSWLTELPLLRDVWWSKYQGPAVLCIAALAGFGMQSLWQSAAGKGRRGGRINPLFEWLFPLVVAIELVWLMPSSRPSPNDPLMPAPYVEYLKGRIDPLNERVYGTGRLLMPHIGAALGIPDTRTYFALYPKRAYRYVRAFLTGAAPDSNYAVFTGSPFSLPALLSPALDVMAARWILTTSKAGDLSETLMPASEPMWLKAEGKGRSGRLVPPGASPLRLDLRVPASGGVLTGIFAAGGGPFDLLVSVSGSDSPEAEFLMKGDHRRVRWQPLKLRLYPWAGKRITVTFEAGKTAKGWGFVSDLLFRAGEDESAGVLGPDGRELRGLYRLRPKYDREILVYENISARPRALVVEGSVPVPDLEKALEGVSSDVSGRRFVFTEGKSDWIGFVSRSSLRAAIVLSDAGNEVVCSVPGDGIRVLFLADTWERWWQAHAGRTRLRVLPSEGMFRSVAVPPGEKRVTFNYEPLPFKLGLLCAGAAFGLLAAVFFGALTGPGGRVRAASGRSR